MRGVCHQDSLYCRTLCTEVHSCRRGRVLLNVIEWEYAYTKHVLQHFFLCFMSINKTYRAFILPAFLLVWCCTIATAQGDCEAVTLDQFFECYGGKSSFSEHSIKAITSFIQAEDAINAGDYIQAKKVIDNLYTTYPVGDNKWWQVWNAPNGANIGTPHGYYGLRMMEDIVAYGLKPNPNAKVKKVNMNIVLVGCSKGIQPTTKAELENGTGNFVTHTLDPKVKENNYRIVRQSLDLFSKYVQAITNGALELHLGFIELDTICLPVSVTTKKPYVAGGDYGAVLNALSQAAKDSTDWFLVTYPSHVPDLPVFDDESFITGGMGGDNKGGPVFIADDKWVTRKPAHLGKGIYTDIERRIYLPQWLQHEFFHHLFRIYPELKLEVNGHDWFDRKFWASDFVGQFETDYYSETLHKRLQVQCIPLASKLITRVDNTTKQEFTQLVMDELIGFYSLDNVQNTWHEGNIIKENGSYFWKNKANVQWQVTPHFTEGILKTGPDCPYPGQDFMVQLYTSVEGDVYPGVVSLKFGGEFYKKRFGLMRQNTPIELALGSYTRVPNTGAAYTGNLLKNQGQIFWKNDAGEQWQLIPNVQDECLIHTSNSSTPNQKLQLILVNSECGLYNLGFKYLDYYYWKPKRILTDESPQITKPIHDVQLVKDFANHTINVPEVFTETKGDSLLYYVTSADTTLIKARIDNNKLILTGGNEGKTTIYLMAVDFNGGLAVNEFTVDVKSSVSHINQENTSPDISVSPSITHDYIYVTGNTNNYLFTITSAINGIQEHIPLQDNTNTVDVSHVPSGVYLLMFTDRMTGENTWYKVIKY